MPNAGTHIIIGTLASIILLGLLNQVGISLLDSPTTFMTAAAYTIIIYMAVVFIYGQLPDIDHHASKVTLLLSGLATLIALIFIVQGETQYAIVILVAVVVVWLMRLFKILKHRGVCHSFFATPILALPLLWFNWQVAAVGAVAFISHIAADRINDMKKRKKRR